MRCLCRHLGRARQCRQRRNRRGQAERAENEPAGAPAHLRHQRRHGEGRDHHAEPGAAEIDAESQGRPSPPATSAGRGGKRAAGDQRQRARRTRDRAQHRQHRVVAGQSGRQQRDRGQQQPQQEASLVAEPRGNRRRRQGTDQVARRVGGVHRACLRVAPAKIEPHRRQQQRIGEPPEAKPHRRPHRQPEHDAEMGRLPLRQRCCGGGGSAMG